MFIRHAEKPTADASGVDAHGRKDDESLIVRGWQRAGALARFFGPNEPRESTHPISSPTSLFAPAVSAQNDSRRSKETLKPLAELLNLDLVLDYSLGDEERLAGEIQKSTGVVLVAWEHKAIASIISYLEAGLHPPKWPGDRFDMVLVIETKPAWKLLQFPQMLLSGDRRDAFWHLKRR
jgi:hypothetical protein